MFLQLFLNRQISFSCFCLRSFINPWILCKRFNKWWLLSSRFIDLLKNNWCAKIRIKPIYIFRANFNIIDLLSVFILGSFEISKIIFILCVRGWLFIACVTLKRGSSFMLVVGDGPTKLLLLLFDIFCSDKKNIIYLNKCCYA